jgi:uncharacterized membrane protein YczE
MSAPPDAVPTSTTPAPAGPAAPRRGARLGWPDRGTHRLVQLYLGLALYGVSMAFFVEGALGVMPWDVLHQGLARFVDVSLGTMTIGVGVIVLLAWIPMRQRPGLGTVSNVVVIGLVVDAALRVLPTPSGLAVRVAFVALGVGLNSVATAAYIGARFGPGPRDGLMTGIVARTGWKVRWVRTAIEVSVVALGWALGGNLGVGTVAYALLIGPLVHPLLPLLRVPERVPDGAAATSGTASAATSA